jgi:hypothetical protein
VVHGRIVERGGAPPVFNGLDSLLIGPHQTRASLWIVEIDQRPNAERSAAARMPLSGFARTTARARRRAARPKVTTDAAPDRTDAGSIDAQDLK